MPSNRLLSSSTATVTQPLYRGGRTRASTNQAKNADYAGRATLIATEEQVFSDTVSAYVGVIQANQLLQLNISNEQVLREQLRAANDRFRVGEITRTDVAQAEAALAGAIAQRETAEGNLRTAQATYRAKSRLPARRSDRSAAVAGADQERAGSGADRRREQPQRDRRPVQRRRRQGRDRRRLERADAAR